jgi:predicted  nucleic acid-binding Zn-ribbon protein
LRQIERDREIRQAQTAGRTPTQIRQIVYVQEIEELAYQFEQETNRQLAAIDTQIDIAKQALQAARDQARALHDQAVALEQQASSLREQAKSLRQWVQGVLYENASPEDQFTQAQEAYNRAKAGGDAAEIQRAGQTYLAAAKAYFASGPEFQKILQEVTGSAGKVADQLDAQAAAMESQAAALHAAAAAMEAEAARQEQLILALEAQRQQLATERQKEFVLRLAELEAQQALRELLASQAEADSRAPPLVIPPITVPPITVPPILFPSLQGDIAPVVAGVAEVKTAVTALSQLQGAANPVIVGGLQAIANALDALAQQVRLSGSAVDRSGRS